MMRPLYEIWLESGREIYWVEACIKQGIGQRLTQPISEEEFAALQEQYEGIGTFYSIPTEMDEMDDEVEAGPAEYFAEYTDVLPPASGTRIHFQGGVVSSSSSPFHAVIFRATFMGEAWIWEVSRSIYACSLDKRVALLSDADYQRVDRPHVSPHLKDWLIECK